MKPTLALAALMLLAGTAFASRELLSKPSEADHCTCEPYPEDRDPEDICATTDPYDKTKFCNAGGHFPILGRKKCRGFFQCTAAGEAVYMRCPKGTRWDVAMNTCVHKFLEIDGEQVCTNQCTGFLYKPYQGCYNVDSLNSGKGAWGLFNTGENANGCGNKGTAASGVGSTGTFAAGCMNSGTAAWGKGVTGEGSCGTGVTDGNHLSP